MMPVPMPQDTIEMDDKVYRRKPWRGGAVALVLVGSMADEKNAEGKPTGNRTFVPLVQRESTNALKSAARKAAKKTVAGAQ
jgi:hypothetical protein